MPRWPMSLLYVAPLKHMAATPLLASPSAVIRSSLTAVTERTLPPLVTTLPSFTVVPAWNTCSPNSLAGSSPTKAKGTLSILNQILRW